MEGPKAQDVKGRLKGESLKGGKAGEELTARDADPRKIAAEAAQMSQSLPCAEIEAQRHVPPVGGLTDRGRLGLTR